MVCVYGMPILKCIISESQQPSHARNLQNQMEKSGFAPASDSACSANKQPSSQTGSNMKAVPNGPNVCQLTACGWVAAITTPATNEKGSMIFHPSLLRVQRKKG